MSGPTCRGTRKDGSPCKSTVLDADGWCFAHQPGQEADRAEARQRGGRNSSNLARVSKLIPARLGGVYDRLERAMGEVHEGTLEPPRANALANLARAAAAVLSAGELEDRVRELEQRTGS
jgi:hypothetical protein